MENILKMLLVVAMTMSFNCVYSQENRNNLDVIIVVDGNILSSTFTDIVFKVIEKDEKYFDVKYYPGNLSLPSKSFYELMSDSVKNIYLKFNYFDHSTSRQKVYNYEIPINKKWLSERFLIIRFYNIDKKENRGFPPLKKGEDYNFDIVSPNYSYILVRNKMK